MLYLTRYELVFKEGETIKFNAPTKDYLKGIIAKNIPNWSIEQSSDIKEDIKSLINKSNLSDHAMAFDYVIFGTHKISVMVTIIFDENLNIVYVDDVNSVKPDAFGAGYSKEVLLNRGYTFDSTNQMYTNIIDLEDDIQDALYNAESSFIQEWYKATGFVELTAYIGGYCLTITDYKFFNHVVEVENLDDLAIYADSDTYIDFSDFESILSNVYCTGYTITEVTALLQAGYNGYVAFNRFATNKRFDSDYLKGVKIITNVSDVDDLGDQLLLQHCDTDYMNNDLYTVLDSIHETIGFKFHNLVSGVFTENDCYVYSYDYTR